MSTPFKYTRLSKDDAALLLVDHQAGLISLVQDFSPSEFKNNVLAIAACGKYFKLPTILTTSFENGPNGPAGAGAERDVPRRALYRTSRKHQRLG
jgi:nicotinamidase-related amidase